MTRYTLVFEWQDDASAPAISAGTEFEGGRCVGVQFSDALAELEALETKVELLEKTLRANGIYL